MAILLQMDLTSVADWQTKSREFSSEIDGDQHLEPAGAGVEAMPVYCVYLDHN